MNAHAHEDRRFLSSGVVLGVAFSGFFDGILLHQILQWHHVLSLVPEAAYQDPRVQIAADGAFHLLMYALAAVGVALLWFGPHRRRPGGASLWRSIALGFGAWNIVDVVLVHWILRWHHVRLDTTTPFAWDAAWLLALGAAPVALALSHRPGHRSDRRGRKTHVFLTLLVLGAGGWASRPPEGSATAVLFRPGTTPAQMMTAVAAADARLIASDPSGQAVIVDLPERGAAWRLYRRGALIVGSSGPAGCAAWTAYDRSSSIASTILSVAK